VSVAPSIVRQALVPSSRTEEIIVVVRQWPCGAWRQSFAARGAAGSRVRLVLAADSSMRRAASGRARLGACAAAAWPAPIRRFCSDAWSVFFYMSAPSLLTTQWIGRHRAVQPNRSFISANVRSGSLAQGLQRFSVLRHQLRLPSAKPIPRPQVSRPAVLLQ